MAYVIIRLVKLVNSLVSLRDKLYKMPSFFKNGNRFLVVEVLSHTNKISIIKADQERRTLHIQDSFSGDNLTQLLSRLSKRDYYQAVLILDPKFATTIFAPVSVIRENSKESIDEGDLDNIISRAIWGFFDRQRSKVAKKMNIGDLDVILSDVQIGGIKLDGHKVVNPLGFQAKTVELQLGLTFTPREFINNIKKLLPKDSIVFVGEDGSVLSRLLSKDSNGREFLLVNIAPEQTTIFSAEGHSVSYVDKFNWGHDSLIKVLSRDLDVSSAASAKILNCYFEKNASPFFIKKIEGILLEELQFLVNAISGVLKDGGASVYLHSFVALPPIIFSNIFRNRFEKTVRLAAADHLIVSEKWNHELKWKKEEALLNSLPALAGVLMASSSLQDEKVSKMAKRRIRWLI